MLSLPGFLSSAHLIDSIHAIKHFQANWFSATFSLENTHWTIYWKDIQKHINHLCVFYFPSRVVPFVIPASNVSCCVCVCIFPRWTKTHRLLLFLSSSLEYSQMWLLYQVFKKLDCRIKYTAFLRWSYRVIFCHYVCFLLNVRLIDLLRCAGVHQTSLQKNIWWNRIFFLVLSHIVQLLNQLISLMVLCFSFQYQYRNLLTWHIYSISMNV